MNNLKYIKDIVSLKAFKPDPRDSKYKLSDRINESSIAFISYGNDVIKIAKGSYNGGWSIGEAKNFDSINDEAFKYLEVLSPKKFASITYGKNITVSLSKDKQSDWALPFNEQFLSFSYSEESLKDLEEKLASKGFKVLRSQLTHQNLMNHYLALNPELSSWLFIDQGTFTLISQGKCRSTKFDLDLINAGDSHEIEALSSFFISVLGPLEKPCSIHLFNANKEQALAKIIHEADESFENLSFKPLVSEFLTSDNPELELLSYE